MYTAAKCRLRWSYIHLLVSLLPLINLIQRKNKRVVPYGNKLVIVKPMPQKTIEKPEKSHLIGKENLNSIANPSEANLSEARPIQKETKKERPRTAFV